MLTQNDHNLINRLISFMFPLDSSGQPNARKYAELWFGKDAETDSRIRELFSEEVANALSGGFNHWLESPVGCLGLMILVDQFPRNTLRGKATMYSGDSIAHQIIETGFNWEIHLSPIQQLFVPCLILTHFEDIEAQQKCLAHYNKLDAFLPKEFRFFEGLFESHLRVIERFGRFPHRNGILGRLSTDEEIEFLLDPKHRYDLEARIDPENGKVSFGRSKESLWAHFLNHIDAAEKVVETMEKGYLPSSPIRLSQDKEDQYRQLFRALDLDGDGKLGIENLSRLFTSIKKPYSEQN